MRTAAIGRKQPVGISKNSRLLLRPQVQTRLLSYIFILCISMSQSRQLAAIMFTDIVGYTKLMGEDEQKAFELLKKNRAVQRPIIENFNGR